VSKIVQISTVNCSDGIIIMALDDNGRIWYKHINATAWTEVPYNRVHEKHDATWLNR
jgi:hypothetical protein